VDDDPGFVALLHRVLSAEWPGAVVHRAYTGPEALALLEQEPVDVIMLDLTLPGMTGLEVLQTMRHNPSLAPLAVIIVTASSYGEELARLRGGRIELLRRDGASRSELGRYIRALLDASQTQVPPAAPGASRPTSAVATPVS